MGREGERCMATQTKLDQEYIAELSRRRSEPAWMTERRLAAWERFEQLPVPQYERTRLKESHFENFVPYVDTAPVAAWEELPEELRVLVGDPAGRIIVVLRNSAVVYRQLGDDVPEGVIVTGLAAATKEHPELVEKYFMNRPFPGGDNKIVALNAALHADGLFVYVPAGVRLKKPVEYFVWIDEPQLAVFDHNIVVAEADSRVNVVETAASPAALTRAYRFGVLELFTGEGARAVMSNVQALSEGVQNLVVRRTVPEPRSHTDWISAEFGGSLSVNEIDSRLNGQGCEVRGLGVFFASGQQHLDLEMRMIQEARETSSDILVRGVVKDEGRAVYGPYTLLKSGAVDSAGFQRGNTLVLDPQARAYSIPQLHVEEENVQGAGHAATVGKVIEEHLFYLRSRGLREAEAKRLIVDGFLNTVLEHIPMQTVRDYVVNLIERKMSA